MRALRSASLVAALLGLACAAARSSPAALAPDVARIFRISHRLPFGPPSASEYLGQIALERGADRLLHHPRLEEPLAGMSEHERDQTMQRLAADGIPRLADGLVVERALLVRDALTRADEPTCAAAWRGETPEQAARLVLLLPPAGLERWSEIAVESAEALLRDDPPHALDVGELESALDQLMLRVTERDAPAGQRLQAAFEEPGPIAPADACWAVRTLYQALAELPTDAQPRAARALITP
jgi:hypothetical protein